MLGKKLKSWKRKLKLRLKKYSYHTAVHVQFTRRLLSHLRSHQASTIHLRIWELATVVFYHPKSKTMFCYWGLKTLWRWFVKNIVQIGVILKTGLCASMKESVPVIRGLAILPRTTAAIHYSRPTSSLPGPRSSEQSDVACTDSSESPLLPFATSLTIKCFAHRAAAATIIPLLFEPSQTSDDDSQPSFNQESTSNQPSSKELSTTIQQLLSSA